MKYKMSSGLRIRDLCQQVIKGRRRFSDTVSSASCHVDTRFAPITFDRQNALVYPDVVSTEECECIMEDVENVLRRKRYEKGHWDAVITNYREAELNSTRISKESHEVFLRIRNFIQKTYFGNRSIEWLPCHGIDLKKNGVLSAHVDSVKFSGEVVAGLSLNSSSIMRLKMSTNIAKKRTGHIDLYLPPLSLYGKEVRPIDLM